jgi:hypothetical protein
LAQLGRGRGRGEGLECLCTITLFVGFCLKKNDERRGGKKYTLRGGHPIISSFGSLIEVIGENIFDPEKSLWGIGKKTLWKKKKDSNEMSGRRQ